MRIYMEGTVSNGEAAKILPTEIFLATECCDDDLTPSENCIMLAGKECECSTKGDHWSSRWKGVDIVGEDDWEETKDKEFIINLIKERKLVLSNMNAYIDFKDEAFVTVTEIYIMDSQDDYGEGTYLDPQLLKKEIEFID